MNLTDALDFVAQHTGRQAGSGPEVRWVSRQDMHRVGAPMDAFAIYTPFDRTIWLNTPEMATLDDVAVQAVLVHEVTHWYQHRDIRYDDMMGATDPAVYIGYEREAFGTQLAYLSTFKRGLRFNEQTFMSLEEFEEHAFRPGSYYHDFAHGAALAAKRRARYPRWIRP